MRPVSLADIYHKSGHIVALLLYKNFLGVNFSVPNNFDIISFSGYSPMMSRPPHPGSFSPFPAQLVYWPGCGYPSPPISPNNYYMTPSSVLTPTSSISNLSNGVTSPGHSSPTLPSQQNLVKR